MTTLIYQMYCTIKIYKDLIDQFKLSMFFNKKPIRQKVANILDIIDNISDASFFFDFKIFLFLQVIVCWL